MTPKLPILTSNKLIRTLKSDGIFVTRQRGCHISLSRHDGRFSTVPQHNKNILKEILRQTGITVDQLRELL